MLLLVFLCGLFLGVIIGVAAMAMLAASRNAEEAENKILDDIIKERKEKNT